MPDAPVTTPDPVADAPVSEQQAPSAESADRPSGGRPFSFARAVNLPGERPAVLSADRPDAPTPAADATDGESASEEVSKPAADKPTDGDTPADPPKLSRREAAAQANQARIAELEAKVQAEAEAREAAVKAAEEQARADERARIERERDAAKAAEQEAASGRKVVEDADRFQRLLRTPDAELSGEDYQWREEQKERLAKYPEVERHFEAVAEQRVAAERAELDRERAAFDAHLRADIASVEDLPHVDPADLRADAPKPLNRWSDMARYYHGAGADWKAAEKDAEYLPQLAAKDDEIGRLKDEVRDLKLVGPRGLGSSRAPVSSGRSAGAESGPRPFDETRPARQNLAAALMAPSNG